MASTEPEQITDGNSEALSKGSKYGSTDQTAPSEDEKVEVIHMPKALRLFKTICMLGIYIGLVSANKTIVDHLYDNDT